MHSEDREERVSRLLRELAEEQESRLPPAEISQLERAALLREVERTLKRSPPRLSLWDLWRARLWPRLAFGLAALAAVVGIVVLTVGQRKRPSTGADRTAALALQWVAAPARQTTALQAWRAPQNALPREMPDFGQAIGTLGAAPDDPHVRARLATVIVRSEHGFGSGTLVSSDGWILSSYRVVANAAQQAAVEGRVAVFEVITARLVERRLERRDPPLTATLYRAHPQLDLALLKLDALPAGGDPQPFLALADQIQVGAQCFVVGSEPNGPAWSMRGGNAVQMFEHRPDFRRPSTSVVGEPAGLERIQASFVVSDALLSAGDVGAPLLNDRGELIGVTCVPAVRSEAGQVAWHVALPDLRRFLADLPNQAEGVPLDLWTAGLPDALALEPELADGDGDGRIDSLHYCLLRPDPPGAGEGAPPITACSIFVDLTQRTHGGDDPLERVPKGLWGMQEQGRFRFDLLLLTRADGVVAVGFPNVEGVVEEIRVGRSGEENARIIWRRDQSGRWGAFTPVSPTPLVDSARIGANQLPSLRAIARENLTPIHLP